MEIVTFTIALCAIIAFHWYEVILRGNRLGRMLTKFPGPATLPYFGHALLILLNSKNLFDYILVQTRIYGKRIVVYIGWTTRFVILCSPEDAEIVVNSKDHMDKPESVYGYFHSLLGSGLITVGAKGWRPLRKMITPMFYTKMFESYIPAQNRLAKACADHFETFAENKSAVNVLPTVTSSTARMIIENLIGSTSESYGIDTLHTVRSANCVLHGIVKRLLSPWLQNEYLWNLSPTGKEVNRELLYFKSMMKQIIHRRKQELENDSEKRKDTLLDIMLRRLEEDSSFTEEDVVDSLMTMIGAGYDTTGTSLSWLLFNLGHHKEYQTLVHEELDEIFIDDPNRDATSEDLKKLKYLDTCLKESLRLFPTTTVFGRKISSDTKLHDGAVLPQGSEVIIFQLGIHRDPVTYPDPMKYDPSRFTPENEALRHKMAFMPFSGGPRNCIGMKHAYTQIKILAVHILRRYTVAAVDDISSLVILPDLIYYPMNGINIKFQKRGPAIPA